MMPSSLVWILFCLQSGGVLALVLPLRDLDSHSPYAMRPPHAFRRLLGHKRAEHSAWSAPGASEDLNWKRAPNGLGASGFYGDVFNQGFGAFSPVKRGFHGGGRMHKATGGRFNEGSVGEGFETAKRRPEMTASGFYDDVFRGGMGLFEPMKRRPEMSASGFYDDIFRGDMGHFEPMKRRPEMSASGFYDDVFRGGMGHFDTMKREVGGGPSVEPSAVSQELTGPRLNSDRSAAELDEPRAKRHAEDETLSAQGLVSERLSGPEHPFSTMR
ncbi:hypothetical protein FJT64_018546 [Amphibalanus amphitrite]|uniref:Uncharacterized protein n=1 Tax=Amphibalanus amphitrite TaxID=1232801 RepID=A0A6A4WYR3_AMPAM|nr:hypothetical protein FJT64_018546 [Amphibalanus amphitrite]